ncbi:MAG: hypothetical protein JWP48_2463 [Actinoallomurus sp.]|jgi:hypothetical protein|nr:hypothetical protein [Actinoallomurus sp.]
MTGWTGSRRGSGGDFDGQPPAHPPQGPERRDRRGRPARRPGSFPPFFYFIAAGGVVFVALVAVIALVISGDGGGDKGTAAPKLTGVRTEGPGASAYSKAASTAAFNAIADRAKDGKPLTAAEVFATKKITDTDAKASLKLTTSSLGSQCIAAIWGTRLAGRLQQGGCTQVARATYSDTHFTAMVTVFNLRDSRAADQVVADADPLSGGGFPLVPPRSVSLGQDFSIARGVAMGHYAVITWVQRADGTGDETDAALLSLLVTTGRPNAVLVRATGPAQH